VTIRAQFRGYTERVLGLAGVADAEGAAGRVLALESLESRLAEVQWTATQNRDATATYNKYTVADAGAGLEHLSRRGGDTPPTSSSLPISS
jgi:putative endopeptidase